MATSSLSSISTTLRSLASNFDEAAKKGNAIECRNILSTVQSLKEKIGFQAWLNLPGHSWIVVLRFLTFKEVMVCETTCKTMNQWIYAKTFAPFFISISFQVQKARAAAEAEDKLTYASPLHLDSSVEEKAAHKFKRKNQAQKHAQKLLNQWTCSKQSLPLVWTQIKKCCRHYKKN
jgi:hypothetical protein